MKNERAESGTDWQRRAEADFVRLAPGDRWSARCYDEVESTMDSARELHGALSPGENGAVLARRQSAGRGRRGRTWVTADGAFSATYVFTSGKDPSAAAGFSLAAGVAVRRVLRELGCGVWLKWPNDVLSRQGAKIGGILVDLAADPGRAAVFCGIGINLHEAPSIAERRGLGTASVEGASGVALSPIDILAPLGVELARVWKTLLEKGFSAFRNEWMDGALFVGEPFTVDCGDAVVKGKFVGIDEGGKLLLETERGRREIVSGTCEIGT